MVNLSFLGSLYYENKRKNFKSNLVLIVVLVLQSKGLYYHITLPYPTQRKIKFEVRIKLNHNVGKEND